MVKFGLYHEPGKGTILTMMLCDVAQYIGCMIAVAQHVWTKVTPEVVALNPHEGSRISFDATVLEYYKFTDSGLERLDYSIGQLENVELVAGVEGSSLMEYLANLKRSRTFADGQIEE